MKTISVGLLALFLSGCMTLPTSAEYVARGDGYFNDGQPQKAVAAYNKAIALNPNNLQAYSSRGAVHFFNGHYELAQQDLEHVLKENPYHADAYSAYGSVLAARGDYERALQIFNTSIRLKPQKAENYFSRAGLYFMLGKYNEALNDYSAVLQLAPAAEVLNARGATYLRMGNNELAEKDFQAAKQENIPATLRIYHYLR